jgi:hypothetical protein
LPPGTYYILLHCGKELRYGGPVTIVR